MTGLIGWIRVLKTNMKPLLVVPVESKDKPIGVIEVLNKRDGSQFSEDDEQLLSAFASQAAVAIENAPSVYHDRSGTCFKN